MPPLSRSVIPGKKMELSANTLSLAKKSLVAFNALRENNLKAVETVLDLFTKAGLKSSFQGYKKKKTSSSKPLNFKLQEKSTQSFRYLSEAWFYCK